VTFFVRRPSRPASIAPSARRHPCLGRSTWTADDELRLRPLEPGRRPACRPAAASGMFRWSWPGSAPWFCWWPFSTGTWPEPTGSPITAAAPPAAA